MPSIPPRIGENGGPMCGMRIASSPYRCPPCYYLALLGSARQTLLRRNEHLYLASLALRRPIERCAE
jgi:hypothetical protein